MLLGSGSVRTESGLRSPRRRSSAVGHLLLSLIASLSTFGRSETTRFGSFPMQPCSNSTSWGCTASDWPIAARPSTSFLTAGKGPSTTQRAWPVSHRETRTARSASAPLPLAWGHWRGVPGVSFPAPQGRDGSFSGERRGSGVMRWASQTVSPSGSRPEGNNCLKSTAPMPTGTASSST